MRRAIQRIIPAILIIAALFLTGGPNGLAQSESKRTSSASNQSCDGALDIVPSGSMTFVRKRRPGKSAPADSKSSARTDRKPGSRND